MIDQATHAADELDETSEGSTPDRTQQRVILANRRRATCNEGERDNRQRMLHLASLLPPTQRAIMVAWLDAGITPRNLALLHRTTPRIMRRRLDRLRDMLADPCFLAAAQNAGALPGQLASLARAYWLEGHALRELAALRGETLHRIRQKIAIARALLMAPIPRPSHHRNP